MRVLYPMITRRNQHSNMLPMILNSSGGGITATLDASYYKGTGSRNGKEREFIVFAKCIGNGQANQSFWSDRGGSLNCMHDQQAIMVEQEERKYVIRRLTPLECCRLQGFPDWWEDGANGSDSARYKMWGNGIALPCATDVLRRIAKEGEQSASH